MYENRKLIAIDPGLSGGIVTRSNTGEVESHKMPDTPQGILELLEDIKRASAGHCFVLMENVGKARPGNCSASVSTFAKHVGHLEMALIALQIPHEVILPTKWMNDVAPGRPKGSDAAVVRKRKRFIKDLMQRKYPDQRITDKTADAFGILTYLIRYSEKY